MSTKGECSMEDKDIVNLIYNRKQEGINELKSKYNSELIKISYSILNNSADSEECVNETYFKVWKTIPPYKPTYLKSFVSKITRQISIDKYRGNHRRNLKESSLNELDYEISSNYSVEDEFYTGELIKEINIFLENLNVLEQVLFIRRYFLNENIKSLSHRFNIKENVVSVRLLRTKKKLKSYLERKGYKIEKN